MKKLLRKLPLHRVSDIQIEKVKNKYIVSLVYPDDSTVVVSRKKSKADAKQVKELLKPLIREAKRKRKNKPK